MAYNEAFAQILRDDLADLKGVSERKMFGGLCIMLNGNMLCGVHKGGGMARVGKDREADACQLDGIDPLSFTGRKMGGMVDINDEALECNKTRRAVIKLAKEFVGTLPAK